MLEIKINSTNENQRLDKYLLKYFNEAPKSFIYKIIRKKYIKLNDKKANGNEIIKNNDIIKIYLSDETINKFKKEKVINSTKQDFSILFEDKNVIFCYKPVGISSQPDIKSKGNSLNEQLLFYMAKNGYKFEDYTPSICNRIDKNTSGIVTFGKNLKSLQALNEIFKNALVDKYYITAIYGNFDFKKNVTLYHKKENNKAIIKDTFFDGSKPIQTIFEPLKQKDNKTLLKVKLITGKTHQIRASLDYMGFSIIGDKKYNANSKNDNFKIKNQFLHCYKIHFKQIDNYLSYLSNTSFLCEVVNDEFKNILKFFNYNIKE